MLEAVRILGFGIGHRNDIRDANTANSRVPQKNNDIMISLLKWDTVMLKSEIFETITVAIHKNIIIIPQTLKGLITVCYYDSAFMMMSFCPGTFRVDAI